MSGLPVASYTSISISMVTQANIGHYILEQPGRPRLQNYVIAFGDIKQSILTSYYQCDPTLIIATTTFLCLERASCHKQIPTHYYRLLHTHSNRQQIIWLKFYLANMLTTRIFPKRVKLCQLHSSINQMSPYCTKIHRCWEESADEETWRESLNTLHLLGVGRNSQG